ncbi:MAG: zinc ribbon domain-containing protein [Candidatus Heimdallarchaeota archaeon]
MSEEESKFMICPNCGAILEKGVQFCGYCGVNVEKAKAKEQETIRGQQFYQTTQAQPQTYGSSYRSTYGTTTLGAAGDLRKQAMAESKINLAYLLSWLAFCFMGAIGLVIAIVSLVFVGQAKKLVGNDPRLTQAFVLAIIAIIGSLISIGIMIFLFTSGNMFPYF